MLRPLYSWWLDLESNQGHRDFQSLALPTELSSQLRTRIKPAEGPVCQVKGDLICIVALFVHD